MNNKFINNMKKIIILIFLLTSLISGVHSQFIQVPLKLVNSSNVPLTGQAGNITFRHGPGYATPADLIGPLTVTEVGTTGNYIITGFSTYQQTKLYVSGVEQTWWGIQWTGDATQLFINTNGTLLFSANQGMNGFKITALANGTTNSDAINKGQADATYVRLDGTVPFTGNQSLGGFKITNLGNATSTGDAVSQSYGDSRYGMQSAEDFQAEPNTIIVDANLSTDYTGKKYRSISSAVTWIVGNNTLSSSNIWSIYVYPSKAGFYTDKWTWPDFINIFGMGKVVVKNTLTFSLFVRTGNTFRNKVKDIIFVQSDQTLNFETMLLYNCAFVADSRAVDFGRFEMHKTAFRDCDIFYDYTDNYYTDDGSNKIMDCNFPTDMTAKFVGSDKVYGWKYVTGDIIDY